VSFITSISGAPKAGGEADDGGAAGEGAEAPGDEEVWQEGSDRGPAEAREGEERYARTGTQHGNLSTRTRMFELLLQTF
jgi:hypothetical protein